MDGAKLSRREVLAGLAITGSSGALVGSGTGALFSDTEAFTNNSIRAATSVSGTVDLDLSTHPTDNEKTYEFDITLPEDSSNNNPAYLWFRLAECPDAEFASHLSLSLGIDCDDDGKPNQYLIGSQEGMESFEDTDQAALLSGLPIDPDCGTDIPGEQTCLDIGEETTVVLKAEADRNFDGSGTLAFEFRARQCRYNDGSNSPFPEISDGCPTSPDSGKAISFVAFCTEAIDDGTEINPRITTVNRSDADGPTSVDWEADVDIDSVVVKAGQQCKRYTYQNSTRSGTVQSDRSDDGVIIGCNPSSPCGDDYGGVSTKLEYDEDLEEFVEETERADEKEASDFTVTIDSTNSPVIEGESLNVDATVENHDSKPDTQTVDLDIDGTTVDSTDVALDGGNATGVTLTWATGEGDAGNHTAEVTSENDSASTPVTVTEPANFEVTIDSTNSPVEEGETVDVTATVENTGDVTVTQDVELSIDGIRDSTNVTLGGGESTTETLNWGTQSGDAGTYTAEVSSEDNSDTVSVTVEGQHD